MSVRHRFTHAESVIFRSRESLLFADSLEQSRSPAPQNQIDAQTEGACRRSEG